ncbi:hypothetical protein [Olsenella sp. Marseille-QA0557]|uniref:hypothetical protein n=1 Tax=Olsenella sp. Marseille-QA0557 TaxID=3378782 RepID=UPI003D0A63E1
MRIKINKLKVFVFACIALCVLTIPSIALSREFEGLGTPDNPYQLNTLEDYLHLSDEVNGGNNFSGVYFEQSSDIDFSDVNWEPIGNSESTAFEGYLNGDGHSIKNLTIQSSTSEDSSAALFGYLGGKIVNLSIEEGEISGSYASSFAAHAVGTNAAIINCISSANVSGDYSAGIAAAFEGGVIANCVSVGTVKGSHSYGITAANVDVKVYRCYTTSAKAVPDGVGDANSFSIPIEQVNSPKQAMKMSISAALSKCLFLEQCELVPMEWEIGHNGLLCNSSNQCFSIVISGINSLAFPILLTLYISWIVKVHRKYKNEEVERTATIPKLSTPLFIITIITYFYDGCFVLSPPEIISGGHILTLVLVNVAFGITLATKLRYQKPKSLSISGNVLAVIIIAAIAEIVQFGTVPRFDANIYYGSFISGCELYNADLLTFLGAFNCWKWMQGIALFAAPLEYLFPGTALSIYISELVLTVISIPMLFSILRNLYRGLTRFQETLISLVFIFSPYITGLFSYFTAEWHLAIFTIWLVYFIMKNDLAGTVFAGLLLTFTKITGTVFYAGMIFGIVVYRVLQRKMKQKQYAAKNLRPSNFMLLLPLIMMLGLLVFGDELTIQNFYGSYVSEGGIIDLFNKQQIINVILQAFIFNFRWLQTVLLLISGIYLFLNRNKISQIIHSGCAEIIIAIAVASIFTVIALCIYKSDANCPRYTTILSTPYVLLIPIFILLFKSNRTKNVLLGIILTLFIGQTYWTIDPSILAYCKSAETGTTKIYRLAYNDDDRPGMNLSSGWDQEYPLICDIYSYNCQYSFYDELISQALSQMDLKDDVDIYILNIAPYELDISGRGYGTYNIYYDDDKNIRSYNSVGTKYISVKSLVYSDARGFSVPKSNLPSEFYLMIPFRVHSSKALEALEDEGYTVKNTYDSKSLYGKMSTYMMTKE